MATVESLSNVVNTRVHDYIQHHAQSSRQSTAQLLHSVNEYLIAQGITGSAWDRRLSAFGRMCVALYDDHTHKGVLCSPQFDVRRVANSVWECKGMVLQLILESADEHGILQDAVDFKSLNRKILNPQKRHEIILQNVLPQHLSMAGDDSAPSPIQRNMVPRAIFALLKWRSNEMANEFAWRNVISFANHPLRRYARLISRYL